MYLSVIEGRLPLFVGIKVFTLMPTCIPFFFEMFSIFTMHEKCPIPRESLIFQHGREGVSQVKGKGFPYLH